MFKTRIGFYDYHAGIWLYNIILNFEADVMYIYGKLYVTDLMPDSANHKLPTLTLPLYS